jgi:hypothetical protein
MILTKVNMRQWATPYVILFGQHYTIWGRELQKGPNGRLRDPNQWFTATPTHANTLLIITLSRFFAIYKIII